MTSGANADAPHDYEAGDLGSTSNSGPGRLFGSFGAVIVSASPAIGSADIGRCQAGLEPVIAEHGSGRWKRSTSPDVGRCAAVVNLSDAVGRRFTWPTGTTPKRRANCCIRYALASPDDAC